MQVEPFRFLLGTEFRAHTQDFNCFATLMMAAGLRSTSSSVVAQLETEIRIAVCPCDTVPPHQQVPSSCMAAIMRRVPCAVPTETKT